MLDAPRALDGFAARFFVLQRLRVSFEVDMKSFSFAKALTVGCLLCLTLPVACGDDDDDSGPSKPGSGGEPSGIAGQSSTDAGTGGATTEPLPDGLSNTPSTKACGSEMCSSAKAVTVYVNPCCAADDACGLDTGFLALVGAQFTEVCQAHNQPGDRDETCADAADLMIPYGSSTIAIDPFVGCCRPNGTCGVVIDTVTSGGGKLPIAKFELGCVDAAPFFKGQVSNCGAGGNGGGGAASGGYG